MLEIPERLPKAKRASAAKRPEDHGQRIELPIAAKVIERHPCQGGPPAPSLRPVENDGARAKLWQNTLLDVIVPDRTVGIYKKDVTTADAPPRPNDGM